MNTGTPLQILIIEDNPAIREVLKMGLEMEGCAVSEAEDGRQALEKLHSVATPNLILLDLLMPGMNGYEFLEEIKKDVLDPISRIPVVVISAVATIARERLSKAAAIVGKPVDLETLMSTIHSIANKSS
jgi:CheY-like chemotaxis protein